MEKRNNKKRSNKRRKIWNGDVKIGLLYQEACAVPHGSICRREKKNLLLS
jgi:hypothetical protein